MQLKELKEELKDLIARIKDEVQDASSRLDNDSIYDRASHQWIAHIEMAIDDDHNWLGRQFTMQDTINELKSGIRPPYLDDYLGSKQ